MSREYKLYLEDMLQAAEKIERYVGGLSFQDVTNDSLRMDAVLHNLMIIGEAAKHIPEDVRTKHPHVEWRNIGRFRDYVAHEYFGLHLGVVQDIIESKLPDLRSQISLILSESD